ncbi:MAG: MarR family transcriptional regulator [Alphaproteobacteria bacterium]|jgi:DNA-binding MarR family transcriptional regulator|nr:MarR family transcriptional regulator [Alphaproteobacteria bacterium]
MDRDATIRKFQAFVNAEGETLGRLLFWAEREVLERTLARLSSGAASRSGAGELTLTQISLLQQLCLGSIRLTDLAKRLGLTKQAAGQIVDTLEANGLLTREPDPADGRAKVIGYTDTGYTLVSHLIDATLEAEREVANEIGQGDLKTLKSALGRIGGKPGSALG